MIKIMFRHTNTIGSGTPGKRLGVFLFLLTLSITANAQVALGRFQPGNTVNFGTWSTSGGVSSNFTACAMSIQGTGNSTNVQPYAIRAYLQSAPGSAYLLTSGTNPADTLPIQLEYSDLYGGGSETLSPNVYTNQDKTGATRNCPGGNNAQITVSIAEANLSSVPAATYSATFILEILGGNGNQTKRANFTVSITIPDLVQISNANPINLGAYNIGSGDVVGSDNLCIFRSGGTNYQITASGTGAAGAFELQNVSAQTIPYSVTWTDSSGTRAVTPNTTLTGLIGAISSDNTCGGGAFDNASLNIRVFEADITAAGSSGNFADTITILLAPE